MVNEKELQNTNETNFRFKKVKKKRTINCMLSGKAMTIRLIAGVIKEISLYEMNHYQEQYNLSRNKTKVELDLSNMQQNLM